MASQVITAVPRLTSLPPADVDKLISQLYFAYQVVPMTRILWEKTLDGPPMKYRYRLETQDGRLWKQNILFNNPGDPGMTFDVTDYWFATAEFANFRDMRSHLIFLTESHGTEKLEVVWT